MSQGPFIGGSIDTSTAKGIDDDLPRPHQVRHKISVFCFRGSAGYFVTDYSDQGSAN